MSFVWATRVDTKFRNLINTDMIVAISIVERDPGWPIGRKGEWPDDHEWAAVATMVNGPNIILVTGNDAQQMRNAAIEYAEHGRGRPK